MKDMTEIEIQASTVPPLEPEPAAPPKKSKRRAAEPAPEQLITIIETMFPECTQFLIKELKQSHIKSKKSRSDFDRLISRIERMAYQVALFQEDTGNTLLIWRSSMRENDHHFAELETCRNIAIDLFSKLLNAWPEEDIPHKVKEELKAQGFEYGSELVCCHSGQRISHNMIKRSASSFSRIGRAEISIDYCSNKENMHVVGNLCWIAMPDYIFNLREFFSDQGKLVDKIQTKAYLTDRRQTGENSTNRECRWETNAASPQFATKWDCIQVEAKLLGQLFEFTNAPQPTAELAGSLEAALQNPFGGTASFRCPVSGQPINYEDFVAKTNAGSRTHGRSKYQVGHLEPLAQTGSHAASNIFWMSELGNRVQGESSLDDIVNEILKMAYFHMQRKGLKWETVEAAIKSS